MSTTTPNASSSRIGPATPIKAITSQISSRSSTSLPPASQTYEPLVKALFRHRLRFTLLLSALATSVVINSWAVWQSGGIRNVGLLGALWTPISPRTLSMTFAAWALVALPVTVLRKVFLTSQRTAASSPLRIIKLALAQNSTRIATITYVASSICALFIHVLMAYAYESSGTSFDPKLTLFVKSRKHPHYLNGRLLFLITTQIFTALFFVVRGAMGDRFVYRWAVATSPKQNWTPLMVLMACAASFIFSSLAITAGSVVFGIARTVLPILYNIPFFSILLRPFVAHFLKGRWTASLPFYHIRLLFRAWLLSFSTFMIWEVADNLFEKVVAESATLSVVTQDPNTALISGVTSTDRIFQFFAYSELRELAMDESASASVHRSALFGDQKTVNNLWTYLSRESLRLLGNDYQLLLRRGLPQLEVLSTPIPTKSMTMPALGTPTPLLRQRIFRNVKDSPGQAALDALASDGPLAQALEAGADAAHVPELFRSVETKVLTSPVAEEAKKNVESVKGVGNRIKESAVSFATGQADKHIPEPVKYNAGRLAQWFARERLSKKVEVSLPYRELDVVVVDVLSYLICASLTEDQYGIVQRDIPKILEVMISFLSAIEEYQIEISSSYKPSSGTLSPKEHDLQNALAVEVGKSQETLGYVADGLKEGIARIVRTFGDKLLAFKFPPRIAQKLQAFLDYS